MQLYVACTAITARIRHSAPYLRAQCHASMLKELHMSMAMTQHSRVGMSIAHHSPHLTLLSISPHV